MNSNQILFLAQNYPGRLFQVIPNASNYLISDMGELISLVKKNPRQLKCSNSGFGYLSARLLHDNEVSKSRYVHHLVAELFIGNRPKDNVVRHLDGNSKNNSLSNLSYGTNKDNEADKNRYGTRSPTNPKLTKNQVTEIKNIYKNTGLSQKKVGELFNVSPMTVNRIINGVSWNENK